MMEPRINEQDEFLLSRLLDGDLAPDEAEALRGRLDREPALRSAYESLASVDRLLADRRSDKPTIDWGRFRAEVMAAVEQEAAPKTLRFPRWVQIGVPMAAAAAIALLVTVQLFQGGPGGSVTTPGQLAVNIDKPPDLPEAGQLLVEIQRPAMDPQGEVVKIKIDFARSDELAEAIRQEDEIVEDSDLSFVRMDLDNPVVNRPILDLPPM